MSYQTRIDEFYRSTVKKRSTQASRKKTVKKEPDDVLDCNIVRKKIDNVHKISLEDKVVSQSILLNEKNNSHRIFDVTDKIQEESVITNDISFITSSNVSEGFSSPNKRKLVNDDSCHLKNMPSKSPLKVDILANDDNHLSSSSYKKSKISNRNSFSPSKFDNSFSTPEKSNYMPTVVSSKSLKSIAREKLFDDVIDDEIIVQSIENMNLAKQGAIPPAHFNLEEIYSKNTFKYEYSNINGKSATKYELSDIDICDDLNLKILFTTIFKVFSNPINCGYFDESELDFVYSMMILPIHAKMLLARMIKRKRGWCRKSHITYPEISTDLKGIFEILDSRSICTFNIKNENLSTMFDLLQAEEIRHLCQKLKISSKGNKKNNIQKLVELSKDKPLFPGMKSPSTSLYTTIFNILDYCVCITNKTWNIIDRIITLLIPNQKPKDTLSDIFFMLHNVYLSKIIYPPAFGYHFPVFSNRIHLLSYVEAKNTLHTVLQHVEKKNWKKVQEYGDMAMDVLPNILENESLRLKDSKLPMHVRHYTSAYIWLKILHTCIEAFKKKTDKARVVEVLTFLLKQNCHMHTSKGEWYTELALIQMHHYKNIEASASVVIQALNEEMNLTQVDKVNLMERANKILKRKSGVTPTIKDNVKKILDDYMYYMHNHKPASITISGTLMSRNVIGKAVWYIKDQSYGSVETLALHHYSRQGFSSGLHCEGALPIILFFILFWKELYDIHVPGAFVTPYQEAPNDLFTEHFYENRKEKIDMKLQIINELDSDALSCYMEDEFETCKQYKSRISSYLQENIALKEIVQCLGVPGVVGICQRLIENFKLWKAGFPDLIVWNCSTKQHKIIEVKGPRDVLSTKQRLWLEYLHQIGLNTEICLVQDEGSLKNKTMNDSEFLDD